jgi:hypothetical protein
MMLVKCFKCKEKSEKETMVCVEKGLEKKTRRYFHNDCHIEYLQEQETKEKDLKELDELYKYLLKLHSIDLLDGRMMEKIQDLRNGSIKINNKKIKKYKQGIPFSLMLDTYKYLNERVDGILNSMQFQTKWNEFSYVFGTMVNNINSIKQIEKHNDQVKEKPKVNLDTVDIIVKKKAAKKDELDISSFL